MNVQSTHSSTLNAALQSQHWPPRWATMLGMREEQVIQRSEAIQILQ